MDGYTLLSRYGRQQLAHDDRLFAWLDESGAGDEAGDAVVERALEQFRSSPEVMERIAERLPLNKVSRFMGAVVPSYEAQENAYRLLARSLFPSMTQLFFPYTSWKLQFRGLVTLSAFVLSIVGLRGEVVGQSQTQVSVAAAFIVAPGKRVAELLMSTSVLSLVQAVHETRRPSNSLTDWKNFDTTGSVDDNLNIFTAVSANAADWSARETTAIVGLLTGERALRRTLPQGGVNFARARPQLVAEPVRFASLATGQYRARARSEQLGDYEQRLLAQGNFTVVRDVLEGEARLLLYRHARSFGDSNQFMITIALRFRPYEMQAGSAQQLLALVLSRYIIQETTTTTTTTSASLQLSDLIA